MIFEDQDKKSKVLVENNSEIALNNVDLGMFENSDLNSLKNEMDAIKNAIDDNSLNLSETEKNQLQEDLDLISKIFNEKLEVETHQDLDEQKLNINNSDDMGDHDKKENTIVTNSIESDFFTEGLFLENDAHTIDLENSNNINVVDEVFDNDDSYDLLVSEGENDFEDDISSDISVDDALGNLLSNTSDEVVISVNNLSMDFTVSMDKIDTLKEFVIRTIKRNKTPSKTVNALTNVSFEITKGDRVGIIGFNGSGKSTLLKLLSRVYYPTEGTIMTKGKIAPLLELGAGFDPNYTGKDNIFLNGAFLGYSEDFLKEKYDEIVEFSELEEAINYHVKTYSSGMRAKLGFSIATIIEPDILILDEILSVGDIKFRRKSADKIKSLINSGITVLLVSHSVGQIRDLCNKAIWLDNGELKMMGNVNEVCDEYVKASTEATSEQLENLDLN